MEERVGQKRLVEEVVVVLVLVALVVLVLVVLVVLVLLIPLQHSCSLMCTLWITARNYCSRQHSSTSTCWPPEEGQKSFVLLVILSVTVVIIP